MSPRSSDNAPAPDIYVSLLWVSLASLLTGIVFLVMALSAYQWKLSP
ncbi:MAG: hypothetical protein JWP89_6807 [Schlesneria sp.]|nr:hypothetical protein [Schlesneria sp.]